MALPIVAAAAAGKIAQNKWTPIVLGVIIIGGVLGTYFLVKKGLCVVGLAECSSDRKADRILKKLQALDAFNPNYYNNTRLTISHESAKIKADDLKKSFGFFNDDEEGVYRVLQSINTPDDMSLVSKYYALRHGSSVVDDLSYYLDSDDEAARMWSITKHLQV